MPLKSIHPLSFIYGFSNKIEKLQFAFYKFLISSCRAACTDIPDPLSPLSLSFIASGRSSELHPISSHSSCMYVCMFELVVLLLLGHKWGSIGVHHLWACLCSSSSVLCAWTKPKYYCIVWNELPQALASMLMHTKLNICALIKQATFPHLTEPLWNWLTNSPT